MLKRANELRQEQEDEVKHLNEVCFLSIDHQNLSFQI